MLAMKILLKIVSIGFISYWFIDIYRKEKSNGLEVREALKKAGTSALGVARTVASAAFVLFGFLGDDIFHDTTGHDTTATDVSQTATQTNIGFVNAIHNDVPTSSHDAFDTHDTTDMPSSNGWDFAASALPWLLVAAVLPIVLF